MIKTLLMLLIPLASITPEKVILETTLLSCSLDELIFLNEFIYRSEVKAGAPIYRFTHGDTTLTQIESNSNIYFKMTVTE